MLLASQPAWHHKYLWRLRRKLLLTLPFSGPVTHSPSKYLEPAEIVEPLALVFLAPPSLDTQRVKRAAPHKLIYTPFPTTQDTRPTTVLYPYFVSTLRRDSTGMDIEYNPSPTRCEPLAAQNYFGHHTGIKG